MLPGTQQVSINLILVGVGTLAAVGWRYTLPQLLETRTATVTEIIRKHLARQAADDDPQVAIVTLAADDDNQFVDFQGVAVDGRNARLSHVDQFGFFLNRWHEWYRD